MKKMFLVFITLLILFSAVKPTEAITLYYNKTIQNRSSENMIQKSLIEKIPFAREYLYQNIACKPIDSYKKILDCYVSLSNLKNNLKQEFVMTSEGSKNLYDITLNFLDQGYNGLYDITTKETFINNFFAEYTNITNSQKEYVIRVAQSLWLEKSGLVSWSIKNYTQKDIEALFLHDYTHGPLTLETTVTQPSNYTGPVVFSPQAQVVPLYKESSYKLFNLSYSLKGQNKNETISELLKWQKKNFFHAYYDWGWSVYDTKQPNQNYTESGRAYPNTLEELFEQRITGCHLNALLYSELLRTLNIPAIHIVDITGHAWVYLPVENKYVHGDHIADFATVPTQDMFLDSNIISDSIQNFIASNWTNPTAYEVLKDKYPFPRHYFVNIELKRSNEGLYLWTDSVSTNIDPNDWEIIKNEVSEYNIQYSQADSLIYSDTLPIKTLEQLSQ